jgi:hypothetical protein
MKRYTVSEVNSEAEEYIGPDTLNVQLKIKIF